MQLLRPHSLAAGPLASFDLNESTPELEDLLAAALSWPEPAGEVTAADEHRWTVRANMVGSLDGGATIDGTSGSLGSPIDQRLIGLQRDLADVVLVGAGTVIGENYPGAKSYPRRSARRTRWKRTAVPPWAIVASRPLPTALRAVTESQVPAIIVTTDDADQPAGTDVIRTGPRIDLPLALAALAHRGHRRILTEGGPSLLGQLATADLVDELSLTISPTLLGTGSARPLLGEADLRGAVRHWHLVSLLSDGDHLFTNYRRHR